MIATRISVVQGDITCQQVDAIVNAANSSLLGGGGVDGAIHRAAGPALLEECRKLGGCPTGEARITLAYRLPAAWVIHAVGPVSRGGGHDEDRLLASCYRRCLEMARDRTLRTIAFPSISTGAYGFTVERASRIALREIREFLEESQLPQRVLLVCFDAVTYDCYKTALRDTLDGD